MDGGLGIGVLNEPVVNQIAKDLGKTCAQIVLRWGLQRYVGVCDY